MKCPRCGFNSFEGLPECKKCGFELGEFRRRPQRAAHTRQRGGSGPEPGAETDHLDLPFEAGEERPVGAREPDSGKQGELFAAECPGGAQPAASAKETGEEFSGGPALPVDLPPEADDGEEAVSRQDDAGEGPALEPALSWRPRLLATAFDLLVVASTIGLFVLCGNLILAGGPGDSPAAYLPVGAAVCFAYFTLFHYLTGQTPGKMLFGLLVECREGGALSFSRAFLRSFGGGLSLLALGCGFAPILWRADGRGWNDRLAGSRVVRLSDDGDA